MELLFGVFNLEALWAPCQPINDRDRRSLPRMQTTQEMKIKVSPISQTPSKDNAHNLSLFPLATLYYSDGHNKAPLLKRCDLK